MNKSFYIFLTIVLLIYALGNTYIFYHGYNAVKTYPILKIIYIILFIILALAYIVARLPHPYKYSSINNFLLLSGSLWLAALEYFVIICILIDIIRLANHFMPFYPLIITNNYNLSKLIIFSFVIFFTAVILIYGYINARNPVINEKTLEIEKKSDSRKNINIVMLSDIHLGSLSCGEWLDSIITKVNSLEPDVILLVGDVIDEDVKPVIEMNHGEHLLNLKSKYGVYAVTGNHEYYGGVDACVKYLQEHNIIVLRDSILKIDNSFYIIGREDREKSRFSPIPRKTYEELLEGVDRTLPIIALNHQPTGLSELEGKMIDLSLSGHTHHGQFFPNNLITEKVYEVSRGLIKRYGTFIYVSSGIGTWGPPIRIGNRPEIVQIILEGK